MNNSELIAYNYGRRLAQESVKLAQEGRGSEMPASAILGDPELTALERLGQATWTRFVLQGGQEVIGAPDAVP